MLSGSYLRGTTKFQVDWPGEVNFIREVHTSNPIDQTMEIREAALLLLLLLQLQLFLFLSFLGSSSVGIIEDTCHMINPSTPVFDPLPNIQSGRNWWPVFNLIIKTRERRGGQEINSLATCSNNYNYNNFAQKGKRKQLYKTLYWFTMHAPRRFQTPMRLSKKSVSIRKKEKKDIYNGCRQT